MEGISSAITNNDAFRVIDGIDRSLLQLGDARDGATLNFENLVTEDEQSRIADDVRNVNRSIELGGRQIKQTLDKDDYLKLLITQLQNQDPTSPMEDREFIAQMAQFSSLEQMTNMNTGFQNLAAVLSAGQATSMLGKSVEIIINGDLVSGKVEEITRGDYPQVLVNGVYFDMSDVSRIREAGKETDSEEAAL